MTEQPARFPHFRRQAESLIQSPERLKQLTGRAVSKLASGGKARLKHTAEQITTAIAALNAWRTGSYPGFKTQTLVILAAAVLYFVVPVDVIPDFLVGWGLIDDMAVIGYVFDQIGDEIDAFKQWQDVQSQEDEEAQPADAETVGAESVTDAEVSADSVAANSDEARKSVDGDQIRDV